MIEELINYNKQLKHSGLQDWQLDSLSTSTTQNCLTFFKSFLFVLVTVTIALPAIIYTLPLRIYLQNVANKKRKAALAKSNVKIRGNDVVASVKILHGIPLVIIVSNIVGLIYLIKFSQFVATGWLTRIVSVIPFTIIFNAYIVSMVQFHNGLNTNFRICAIRIFVIFYKRKIKSLRKIRRELQIRVFDFVTKYNKMVIEKYEKIKERRFKRSKTNNYIDTEEAFSVLDEFVQK